MPRTESALERGSIADQARHRRAGSRAGRSNATRLCDDSNSLPAQARDDASATGHVYLARHGIEASFTATLKAPGVDTGAMLLDALTDRHADLLVMGAYGHARVQERLVGGVTRNVLQALTVPVLMSH